jgi:DNA invertase Pin-like site-specific DNA recombinase
MPTERRTKVSSRSRRPTTRPRPDATRRAGLVERVSTDRQAANDEGSLKNQLLRLRAHLEYKWGMGERWEEVALYELKAVSGKHSLQSPELQRLLADIAAGRINTVCCTA